jgi:hypothetical protein
MAMGMGTAKKKKERVNISSWVWSLIVAWRESALSWRQLRLSVSGGKRFEKVGAIKVLRLSVNATEPQTRQGHFELPAKYFRMTVNAMTFFALAIVCPLLFTISKHDQDEILLFLAQVSVTPNCKLKTARWGR